MEKNNYVHLKIAISHALAGGLYYGMDLQEITDIIKEVVDEYKQEWKKETKANS
jgi:hypothetical protein